ncbi:MAG TPA: hypothetical protein VJ343_01600 [archaeon]|nr:hypothetical protein [archaeon]
MPEDNLSILEKRISDLEADLASIKEKFEDIQDLVMVEQAGILEIKNMIEEVKATSPEASYVLPNFEERLKKIENDIFRHTTEIGEKSGGTLPVAEVERIYGRIDELEERIAQPGGKDVDFEFNESKIAELSSRIESMENALNKIEQERTAKETGSLDIRREVESEIGQMKQSEDETKRVMGSVSELSKEFDRGKAEMLQRANEVSIMTKKIEDSNRVLSSSVYSEIKALKGKIENLEAEYYELSKKMKYTKPEEFEKAMEKIGSMAISIEDDYRRKIDELKETLSKTISELRASVLVDEGNDELMGKIVSLEGRLKVIEKNMGRIVGSRPVILE